MTGRFRTAEGGRIDRDRRLAFTFDGRRFEGFAGDTLASALLAHGVHLVARSFKYHRPRGIFSAGAEEPNALVRVGRGGRATPNLRATQVELYDGLVAESQNRWPSLAFDLGAVANVCARLLPAGFYYKTFMWPPRLWMAYEALIRRAAGMGRAPDAPDPDIYDKMHVHCDVLVVGGGPAGLAAALAAGRTGARVILADEQHELGGSLLRETAEIDGRPALDWVAAAEAELTAMTELRVLRRATVFAYYDHNYLGILERVADHLPEPPPHTPRQRLWKVRAAQVVLATGAIERPLVFPGNDRPGVMLAGAAQTYLNRYGVKVGRRAVVFTNNDSAYAAALDLATAGIEVTVVDLRRDPAGPLTDSAAAAGLEILDGYTVTETQGRKRIGAVEVMPLDDLGEAPTGSARRIACDVLCVSGGWTPTVHLFSQSQGRLRYDGGCGAFVPDVSVQDERSAGACRGTFGLGDSLAEGHAAGIEAAAEAGFAARGRRRKAPAAENREEAPARPLWIAPSPHSLGEGTKAFVDLQNDVTVADIELAVREGYESVEHLKRYTTTGMGTDQGKTGNLNALAVLSETVGEPIPALGFTTYRPPYTPVTFGALAGRDIGERFDPVRRTPMQAWHEQAGAVFENVGQWRRPFYYPRRGEMKQDAVYREVRATRASLGILDASTLGKIDIQGPDAVELLNRIYTNDWDTLEVGRCRYGLMCGEDGMVFDDGITARLGEHHYLMHTTTGNAARVLAWIEEWLQTEWPDLRVWCTSVTEQFATVNLAGPNARRLLADLGTDIDLDPACFPFMACREGTVAGLPARVLRVSYTGELSYEISVPASYGMALWTACMTVGEDYAITPFGTEALHVLRAEKGYIAVGQETDGTVTPLDLGLERLVSRKKDFLGKRSLARADMTKPDRPQLIGLLTEDAEEVLPEGAPIVEKARPKPPIKAIGHVTSSYHSPTLERSIALAMLAGGRERIGTTVELPLEDGRTVRATVAEPMFFDPKGERLHA